MRIADVKYNDIVDGEGVCVSVWFQGCPFHCKGCHNPETWDFEGGYEIEYNVLKKNVLNKLNENNVLRNLSFLGGEPLCDENIKYTTDLAKSAKEKYPSIKIYCWTGNLLENIIKKYGKEILTNIDVLIDGPFLLNQRDITLKLRGSKNQRILQKNIDF